MPQAATTAGPPVEALPEKHKLAIKPILQVTSGNALEIYDFFIYGYYAVHISGAYFPNSNPFISLMLTLLTFALGFLARPVGAIIIGSYSDRHGRRAGLILSLSLMSVGIISLACTPSYSTIGLAAPLIVMAGRLLQGFSAGAELGGVVVYLAETASPGRRAFYTCWQVASQQFAVMAAAIIGVVIFSVLSPAQMSDWGWRVPLLVGCAVVPIMFWLRSSLVETAVFARKGRAPTLREICSGL
ncbi:MAG: MFS transporter, partial [Nevskia sp.]|nr:MFS transporter [Nevskia sp.]